MVKETYTASLLTATEYIKKNNKKQAKDFIPLHKIFHPMHTHQRQSRIREESSGMVVLHATMPALGRLRQENHHKHTASLGYARSQLKKPKAMTESKKRDNEKFK